MHTVKHLYKLLLLLYPHSYRAAFGPQMLQTFADHYTDVAASAGRVGLDFWLFLVADECKNIAQQHILVIREGHGSLSAAVATMVVAAALFTPLSMVCYAIVVTVVLALPHPPVSGIGFLIALMALILLLAAWSMLLYSVLARLMGWARPKRHKSVL